ncbi:MAG: metallophosphoesterase [Candidatus Diapherotrites archaeon]|nr:metallophosphoesterase [Candidatus Diapherotrites archaeon]
MNEEVKEIVEYATNKNIILSQRALDILIKEDYKKIIDELENIGKVIIEEKDVEEYLIKSRTKVSSVIKEVIVEKVKFKPIAKEINSDFKILEEYDITRKSTSEGKVEDFLAMFRDKFQLLSTILRQRPGFKPKNISEIKKTKENETVDFIGMVAEKWITKNGNLAIRLEDLEDECIVIAKRDNNKQLKEVEKILNDDVIGIKARCIDKELFFMEDFFWPDLEQGTTEARRELNVALISDIHVGSKLFLEREFLNMLKWINGKGQGMSEKEREEAGRIKYLVIAGDNVDGIGVYPEQYEELAIKDVYKQYETLEKYLELVPEHIEVFICPGQHDAVRRAEPQPAISKEYLPNASKLKNIHLVGNPSWFEIEGLKCIIYHGASIHDLAQSIKDIRLTEPEKAIIELLKRRDLMVSYGLNNPYLPESKNFMIIREKPDFYFGGDLHHTGYGNYRGCTIMNGSTWQLQTEYQKEQGHVPTPGILLVANTKTRKVFKKNFYEGW